MDHLSLLILMLILNLIILTATTRSFVLRTAIEKHIFFPFLYKRGAASTSGFDKPQSLRITITVVVLLQNCFLASVGVDRSNILSSLTSNVGNLALINVVLQSMLAFPETFISIATRLPRPHILWAHVVISWLMVFEVATHLLLYCLSSFTIQGMKALASGP